MGGYKDLEIFQLYYELALKIHKVSLALPKYELFEEGSQIRRSSKAITSSIAEGYGRKRYKADFIKYLTYAHASCDETIVHLNLIMNTHAGDINKVTFIELLEEYNHLGGKLNNFIQYVDKEWQ